MIRSVVFDIGETLLDDTREWRAWADWLSVPPHTVSALVGAVVAQGMDNVEALRLIRPGIDVAAERLAREQADRGEQIHEADLYPDVRATLAELRMAGVWVGVAGNQTALAADLLRGLDLPVDEVATSGEWGVAKPSGAFFQRITQWAPGRPEQIVYVGDYPDHDIGPAHAAGLRTALIRRGPWGYLWADDPAALAGADWRLEGLADLLAIVAARIGDP